MVNVTVALVVAGFAVIGLILYLVIVFNGLILLKVNIDKAWANIDVLLKQRHDEVPNLVAVVESVKDFEQKVLTSLTQARSQAMAAVDVPAKARADGALTQSLNRLFAVGENYPQLTAQANYLQLQKRLSELEGEISDRRAFYNDSVARYNARIAQFPDLLLAGTMGLAPCDLFKADEDEKSEVQVGFSHS
jgi:LemA protein